LPFDALLIVSFGGPEGMEDVMPFLENVLRGRNVPEERKKEVAHHYEMFNGVSPINVQNRELKKLLEQKLSSEGIDLPVFWGNRNWKPYIQDALLEMKSKGIQNALAYVTSAYGSYSGCRQYLENIAQAQIQVLGAPHVQKLPLFYDQEKFIRANAERVQEQLSRVPDSERANVHLAFTAHSIPISMSETSPYVNQLMETATKVADEVGVKNWKLAFQSRSGPPHIPWLAPDICEHLEEVAAMGVTYVIVSPLGFLSDHMEVVYDLDVEAKKKSQELGLHMLRAKSVGNHPLMVEMIVDLIKSALRGEKLISCAQDCCPSPRR
jgi:ferrochelatase